MVKTFIRLQYNHIVYMAWLIKTIAKTLYQILYEDARFLYIVLNKKNPIITEIVEVNEDKVLVNNYHTRYEGTARAA